MNELLRQSRIDDPSGVETGLLEEALPTERYQNGSTVREQRSSWTFSLPPPRLEVVDQQNITNHAFPLFRTVVLPYISTRPSLSSTPVDAFITRLFYIVVDDNQD